MLGKPPFLEKELPIVFELLEVIQASFDATTVAPAVFPLLSKLIAADHFALALSRTPDLRSYDWSVADMPSLFFRDYDQLAHLDFVRLAVAKKPNIVLTDADILAGQDRALVLRNPFYQATREMHMPVEQVLGVMIAKEPTWVGGLTLYRDKARPFTAHERDIFQFFAGRFAIMMGHCKRFAARDSANADDTSSSTFESALKLQRTSWILLDSSWRWVGGANDIERVFSRCFGSGNRALDGLPLLLREYINNLAKKAPPSSLPSTRLITWIPARTDAGVVVSFIPLVKEFGMQWLVLFDEVPTAWRDKLSRAEIGVAIHVAQGWDNGVVAKEMGLSPATIRTHLVKIFDKLGIDRREMLVAQFKSRG